MKTLKQLTKSTIVFAVSMATFFSSCEDSEEVKPDNNKLLTLSEWKYSGTVNIDALNATTVDALLGTSTLTFKTGGVLESNFFTIDATNTWIFSDDETKIIIDQGLDSEDEWTIVSLTETEFIYRDDDDNDAGGEALPFSLTDGKPLELKFLH